MVPLIAGSCDRPEKNPAPNILIAIADDQSHPFASYYGTAGVRTPGFDGIAQRGVCFDHAYATSPGSSPSRASLLTGLYPWQIEEAGTHASSFPAKYLCFPEFFARSGYKTGYTGKGWGPGDWKISGRTENPAGPEYNAIRLDPPYPSISDIDYTANFASFLDGLEDGQPFCFWYGAREPHRPYTFGSGRDAGLDPGRIQVPSDLPDADEIRTDLADYAFEIEWFDAHLQSILSVLKTRGMLENTIVIVTADNGMPFPHAKANCYDAGIHVPLAICWGKRIRRHGLESQIVSLVDIFPTLLELCGIEWKESYSLSGNSLVPLLMGGKHSAPFRPASLAGRERHSSARPGNLGYPSRSIRTGQWLLIRNFHPERWPAGDPLMEGADGPYAGFFDIDPSPTLRYLIDRQEDTLTLPFFRMATGKRPEYELYDIEEDPACCRNLYTDPAFSAIADSLRAKLLRALEDTGDSRLGPDPEIWESYPRLAGPIRSFPADSTNSLGDMPNCCWKHLAK